MKLSTDRILTTHVGSLPRPQALLDLLVKRERGEAVDADAFEATSAKAVEDIVAQQAACGIDVVSDGEMSKPSYTMYVRHRVKGIEMRPEAAEKGRHIMVNLDAIDHPDYAERNRALGGIPFPGCVGPLTYADTGPLERDLAHLKAAAAKTKPVDVFMTAPSPGILTRFIVDLHYNDYDKYLAALAEAMKTEYRAIVGAGLNLQIDAPDLGSARANQHRDKTEKEFIAVCEKNVEALNHALQGLPADSIRLHICWGNYEGPHTHDIALSKIIGVCFKANTRAFSFEGANPRHEHEWEDLKEIRIPDDKVLIPGVIDSTTNFVEHPKLVAQRIGHYVDLVGQERVIAGADCGFGTFVTGGGPPMVAPSIVWAKFRALAEGARMATQRAKGKAA
jgi:5-methyltetrahydropteroyltriglutamate--homocysteine methyltransferase